MRVLPLLLHVLVPVGLHHSDDQEQRIHDQRCSDQITVESITPSAPARLDLNDDTERVVDCVHVIADLGNAVLPEQDRSSELLLRPGVLDGVP
jgi:hypothetical protein